MLIFGILNKQKIIYIYIYLVISFIFGVYLSTNILFWSLKRCAYHQCKESKIN